MKRAIVLLLAMTLSLYTWANSDQLVIGTTADDPPFTFIENRRIAGFDIDLIKMIAANLGYKLEIRDTDHKHLLEGLKNKEFDAVISTISPTKEGMRDFAFSSEYYYPDYAIIHMRNQQITSEDDLNGKTIGVADEAQMRPFIKRLKSPEKKIKIMKFNNIDFALDALELGRIDAILDDNGQAQTIKNEHKAMTYFLIKSEHPSGYAIILQRDSELLDKFNDELLKLKVSRQLEDLKTKWGL